MGRQTKFCVVEKFITDNNEDRQQKFNELLIEIINKSELSKTA